MKNKKIIPSQFQFPLITKVNPSLISTQIITVQPMSIPSGGMYFINPVIEDLEYLLSKKIALRKEMNDFYENELLSYISYSFYVVTGVYTRIEFFEHKWNKIIEAIEATKKII